MKKLTEEQIEKISNDLDGTSGCESLDLEDYKKNEGFETEETEDEVMDRVFSETNLERCHGECEWYTTDYCEHLVCFDCECEEPGCRD